MQKYFSMDEIHILNAIMDKQINRINTLNDYLEAQIIDLLKLGYMFCDDESNTCFTLNHSVFVNEEETEMLEDNLLNKINTLLECYSGKKSFFVQIAYNRGSSNISILV